MEKLECVAKLYDLKYTAGMNTRYHHQMMWWLGAADKLLRIIIGVVAVVGIFLAIKAEAYPNAGIWLAVISAVLAFILNVVPLGDWEKSHVDLFRSWSDIRSEAELSEMKLAHKTLPPHRLEAICERIFELTTREHQLCASEPAPFKGLLLRCQEDETESLLGKGIRTPEDADRERSRRLNPSGAQAAAMVPGDAEEVAGAADK